MKLQSGKYQESYISKALVRIYTQPSNTKVTLISSKTNGVVQSNSVQIINQIDDSEHIYYGKMNANYFVMSTGQALGIRCGVNEWSVPRQGAFCFYALKYDGNSYVGMDNDFWYTKDDIQFACSPALILMHNGKEIGLESPACRGSKATPNTQSLIIRANNTVSFAIVCGKVTPQQCLVWAKSIEGIQDLCFMDSGGSSCLQVGNNTYFATSEKRKISNAVAFYKEKYEGSDSKLIDRDYRGTTKNYSSRNGTKIDRVVVHHMAGSLTNAQFLSIIKNRQSSATYTVDKYGKIGYFIDEKYRPWTTSTYKIDNRAITIEVANDSGNPNWHVSDLNVQKTIDLIVDICKRNGITKFFFEENRDTSILQAHKWWASTACPGPYLYGLFPYIAEQVQNKLNGSEESKYLYCVQVGAFKKYTNAVSYKEKLAKDGYTGFVVKVGDFYKVQVGAFAHSINASKLLDELKQKDYVGFVTKKEVLK